MNEDSIIGFLKSAFPQSIGDDAAVLSAHTDEKIVISKDLLVEDVHFRRRYQTADSLAYKALAVNLSDIAAMGATPFAVFLGLSASSSDTAFVDAFLKAFVEACRDAKVILMGGDTTGTPSNQLYLSITILGRAKSDTLKYRHTAQPGDVLYVAGPLGKAHRGFTALERNLPGFDADKAHFLNPRARVTEGLWLANQPHVHAMMDLSDGLWTDLHKLIQASQCSAMVSIEKISPTETALLAYQALGLAPVETQLSGGEDYALLFSVAREKAPLLNAEFELKFSYPLLEIGEITASEGTPRVQLFEKNTPVSLRLQSFNHFAPP